MIDEINPLAKEKREVIPQGVKEAIARADDVLTLDGRKKEPKSRKGACGFASDLLLNSLQDAGYHGKVINLWMLNLAMSGKNSEQISSYQSEYAAAIQESDNPATTEAFKNMEAILKNSFQHACVLFKINEDWFLGDISFCQFVDDQGIVSESGIGSNSIHENSFLYDLYTNGLVKLTPSVLTKFAQSTATPTLSDSFIQLDEEGMEKAIINIPAIPPSHSNEEIEAMESKQKKRITDLKSWFKTNKETYTVDQLTTFALNRGYNQSEISRAFQIV